MAAMEEPEEELVDSQPDFEASYTLESTVSCPLCRVTLSTVNVVRLLRTKVNFTSTLPRRGYLIVCPTCRGIVPAAIASWMS